MFEGGGTCVITAPNSLSFVHEALDILVTPDAGESAEVTVKGSVVECRETQPPVTQATVPPPIR
jgi:hypothetical protein